MKHSIEFHAVSLKSLRLPNLVKFLGHLIKVRIAQPFQVGTPHTDTYI